MSEKELTEQVFAAGVGRRTLLSMTMLVLREAHIQARVGFRLALREIIADVRLNQLGMAWIVLSPLIYLSAFMVFRGMVSGGQSGVFSLNAFSLLAGLIMFQSWMEALSGQLTSYANNSSFLKNIGVTPDVFFYSALTKGMIYCFPKLLILFSVGLLMGERPWSGMPIYGAIFFVACLNGAAVGYVLAPLASLMNDVRIAIQSSNIVLMAASSVFLTMSTVGSVYYFVASIINPVAVFVENGRYWLTATPTEVSIFLFLWIPATLIMVIFSLALNRLVKQIIAERL